MMEDKEIHTLLLLQSEKGLDKIMNQYIAFVYTIVYGHLSSLCNKQDIEECVNSIFYEFYKSRNLIDLDKGSLKAYLAVLAKRKAIDCYRKHRNTAGNVSIDELDHDWIPSPTNVENTIDKKVSRSLAKLKQTLCLFSDNEEVCLHGREN